MVSPLLPLLLSTIYFDRLDRPLSSRLLDQDFGIGLRPEQLELPRYDTSSMSDRDRMILDLVDAYYRPLPFIFRPSGGGAAAHRFVENDTLNIILDVQQFKPEEIDVTVKDNFIVIKAKHEEKKDEHGLISRQFVRRYDLPKGVDPDTITSEISSDGVLTIKAPVKKVEEDKNVRKVKIELTGKPAIKHHQEDKEAHSDNEKKEATSTSETPHSQETTASGTTTEK